MGTILALLIICGLAYYLKEFLDDIERKQAIAKETKRKQRVLEEARKDKNVFIYNSTEATEAINSAGGLNELKQSSKNAIGRLIEELKQLNTKNLEQFSEEIERQFKIANDRCERAELLINDEISRFRSYQKKMYDEKIIKYENLIQLYKSSLSISENYKSEYLRSVTDYTIPNDLSPDNLSKDLNLQLKNFKKGLMTTANKIGAKRVISKEEAMAATAAALLSTVLHGLDRAKKRKILQKESTRIGEVCRNIQSNIEHYGKIQSKIQQRYKMIERNINSVGKIYPEVKIIRDKDKSFQQLNSQELKLVNALHSHGEILKKNLTTDIFR